VIDFLQNLCLAVATVATQNGPVATAVATAVATVATKRVRVVPAPAPRLGRTACCMVVSDFWTWTNAKNKTEGRCLLCDNIHKGGLGVMLGMRDWFSSLHMMQAVHVLQNCASGSGCHCGRHCNEDGARRALAFCAPALGQCNLDGLHVGILWFVFLRHCIKGWTGVQCQLILEDH
jgi:hypothetical protein